MNNRFIKIFEASGSGGTKRLESEINAFASHRKLKIISADCCFRKGTLSDDVMFVVVLFEQSEVGGLNEV